MRRYLVVANRTLGGEHLLEAVRECMAAGECEFHVVVPANDPNDGRMVTDARAHAAAEPHLAAALERFRGVGATVTGEIGDARAVDAIADALRGRQVDEIILSTLPPGPSAWLRQDLPHRVERAFDLPVRHLIARRDDVHV